MTPDSTETYLSELRTALELRDADDDLITDVIRQVQSHLFDTGEDPYDAFGDPRDYAKQHAPDSTPSRFWALIVVSVVLTVVGGWLLSNGVINLVGENLILWGVSPFVEIFVGSLLIATWIITLAIAGARRRGRAANRG